jgi:hypothetical protein
MNRSRYLYAVLWIIVVLAAGYYAYTFLAPPEGLGPANATVPAANTAFVSGKDFSNLNRFVNLPITATDVGWPLPFQSIYDRNVPGVYVNENANANANGNANVNAPY